MWIKSQTFGYLLNSDLFRVFKIEEKDSEWRLYAISQTNEDLYVEEFNSQAEAEEFLNDLWKTMNRGKIT